MLGASERVVTPRCSRGFWVTTALTAMCAALCALAPVPASAAGEGPQWTVSSVARPTNLTPGDLKGDEAYVVTLTNTGSANSSGPVTITDELPEGLTLDESVGASGESGNVASGLEIQKFECKLRTCTYNSPVIPDETLVVRFPVDVALSAPSSVTNVVRVSGGGALDALVRTPTTVSSTPAEFGISPGGASTSLSSAQAGAHPDVTTNIAFNTVTARGALAGDPKDTSDELPPGFASDFVDTPSCPASQFLQALCPIGSQVGVITLKVIGNEPSLTGTFVEPVYDIAPDPGAVAKIGFVVGNQFFFEGTFTLRPGDYGATVTFANANQGLIELDNLSLTVWGVPAASVHDPLRWQPAEGARAHFGATSDAAPEPFVSNPTLCGNEPLTATFKANSWEQPSSYVFAGMSFGPIGGCDQLTMAPEVALQTTTPRTSAPTGLNLKMQIPQTYNNAEGLATANLKRAVVTLPEGMTVNPSAGAGLVACSQAELAEEAAQFVPGRGCPSASKLGTITAQSPAVQEAATGSVFIAEPYNNPFHSLLALYVVARIPNRGIIVKAEGEVVADPLTGRLITTFDNLPPLPISALTFSFRQGATSPLVTPPLCGDYTASAALTPWSDPAGAPLFPDIPGFEVTSGFDGGACPSGGQAPISPQVSAGTENAAAGAYSPMSIRIVRGDGEQEITGFSAQLPLGLTADLSGVPFCPDAAIEAARSRTGGAEEATPSCPAASRIGHTLVGAGVGSILAWTPGQLYLAGPYNGAPFSVVAVTTAKVGPFDLGTVVVREALRIDPITAAVTVDAGASDQIPHILKGIVVHVRDIRVYTDRPNFTLNPTSCSRTTFAATVMGAGMNFTTAADDVPVLVDTPFQVAECQTLNFKPTFRVTVSGKTSKKLGAGLKVRLTYPSAPQGTQANIRSVKVSLPLQLPSRLTTLQKACTNTVFNANPAACPAQSRVGQASAITPILPVPLAGPAYFVSYGGAKFPELVLVLQGYGVTIELHGETFISKAGITSSTFHAVPDQPVSSFELTLPQGPNSALAANGSLCHPTRIARVRTIVTEHRAGRVVRKAKFVNKAVPTTLVMPTAFAAQNGAVIDQNTPVAVSGCPRQKANHADRQSQHHGKGAGSKLKK